MVENESSMYDKLVAGRDAKVTNWTDSLTLESLALA